MPPKILRALEFRRMSFELELTVRFAETDAQGIAHHAAYLVWFETARIEYRFGS
jgi:acyl-CoA thioesterase FadM